MSFERKKHLQSLTSEYLKAKERYFKLKKKSIGFEDLSSYSIDNVSQENYVSLFKCKQGMFVSLLHQEQKKLMRLYPTRQSREEIKARSKIQAVRNRKPLVKDCKFVDKSTLIFEI